MALKEWREKCEDVVRYKAIAANYEHVVNILEKRLQAAEATGSPAVKRLAAELVALSLAERMACPARIGAAVAAYRHYAAVKDSIRATYKKEGVTIGRVDIDDSQPERIEIRAEVRKRKA